MDPTPSPPKTARKPRAPMTDEAKAAMIAKRQKTKAAKLEFAQKERQHSLALQDAWKTKDITIEELLTTDPDASIVLHGITEQVDFAGDNVLQLLIRHHRQTFAWYLNGPDCTLEYSKGNPNWDVEAEAVAEGGCHTWGYTVHKRHACINIWCNTGTVYDSWRAYLLKEFGHGGELHDPAVDLRVWND